MSNQTINLPTDVEDFQFSIKTAIEHFQGSPVKNQNKLNETTAIALGFKNYDSLSAAIKEEDIEPLDAHWADDDVIRTVIEGFEINEDVFNDELVDWKLVEREQLIDDLIMWISEGQRSGSGDVFLMKEDLKMLMQLEDEYIFSSIVTNEYISPTEDTKEFNEICNEILEANKNI